MPRPRLERLSAGESRAFRDEFQRRMRHAQISRADLIDAFRAPGAGRSKLPERSQRWIDGALSSSEAIPRLTAVELVLRLHRLGVRLPDSLLAPLQREEPAVIVFPGESKALADRIGDMIGQRIGISGPATRFLKEELEHYFSGFEEVAKLDDVRARVVDYIKSSFAPNWRLQLSRLRRGGVSGDRKSYVVPSLIADLENEYSEGAQ